MGGGGSRWRGQPRRKIVDFRSINRARYIISEKIPKSQKRQTSDAARNTAPSRTLAKQRQHIMTEREPSLTLILILPPDGETGLAGRFNFSKTHTFVQVFAGKLREKADTENEPRTPEGLPCTRLRPRNDGLAVPGCAFDLLTLLTASSGADRRRYRQKREGDRAADEKS